MLQKQGPGGVGWIGPARYAVMSGRLYSALGRPRLEVCEQAFVQAVPVFEWRSCGKGDATGVVSRRQCARQRAHAMPVAVGGSNSAWRARCAPTDSRGTYSLVTKLMNSDTNSWTSSLASLAILAFVGSARFMILLMFAIGRNLSCSRTASSPVSAAPASLTSPSGMVSPARFVERTVGATSRQRRTASGRHLCADTKSSQWPQCRPFQRPTTEARNTRTAPLLKCSTAPGSTRITTTIVQAGPACLVAPATGGHHG